VAVRANPTTKAFHYSAGEPNAPLLRFVLESVSDIAATPVDAAKYTKATGRDISLEEAHALVTAFMKDRGSTKLRGFDLDQYANNDYPDFQFFQAIFDNPRGSFNLGHYAVDRKTGDVWNAVICEQLTSPSLARLKSATRRRIGLTEDEYRKTQRMGPMCEPGYPRVVKDTP
jgi:hypothetical protein